MPPKKEQSTGDPADQQLRLVLAAWRNMENGKVNYKSLAEELDVVSPAAVQKRLERTLKPHGMKLSDLGRPGAGTNNGDNDTPSPAGPSKGATPRKRAAKGEGKGSNKKARVEDTPSPFPSLAEEGKEEANGTTAGAPEDEAADFNGEEFLHVEA